MALDGWNQDNILTLTIDHTKIDEDLTDFPILVHLSASAGVNSYDTTAVFTELTSASKKIAITDMDDNQLYVEIEDWDNSNNEAWLWTKVPSASASEDTILYLYYDSTQADNTTYVGDTGDTPAQNVWYNDFLIVYHMNQDPSTGGASVIDSTSNNFDGTPYGLISDNLVDCKIGNGLQLENFDDRITLPDPFPTDPTELTFELISKTDDIVNEYRLIGYNNDGLYATLRLNQGTTSNKVHALVYDGGNDPIETTSYTLTDYHYFVLSSKEGGNTKLYIDNDFVGQDGGVTTFNNTTDPGRQLGSSRDGTFYNLDGNLDEFRLSNIQRSDAWIKTTYYSNWDDLVSYSEAEVTVYPRIFIGSQWINIDGVWVFINNSWKVVSETKIFISQEWKNLSS